MTALDDYFVGYGPEQIEDIQVHERPDGSSVIETVTYRPIRVFEYQPDRSLIELHGEDADRALEAFWAEYDRLAEEENDR
ncbi:hypothetical protein [Streptomyces aurantiogriseus]|uniref:Uncharacterized protein n=1 Tax=Streptomyces aurantiogriseus TaxID=66870 RepID=A0A918CHI8_9ACTN|nr:hypothetical protein [Streptomyces aurantiogriseus]GGR24030.1 hypothetical protein GCM10010251_45130 [Streptomyces aurantiogriseus]